MKPITVDNAEGRTLLALRAGPMTSSELSARVGNSPPSWLVKAGYIAQDGSCYRITDAGRVACPYRNPLAAPGGVQPITVKPEVEMSKENVVTRQQVLAALEAAGPAGISPKQLITDFDCSESVIYNHVSLLGKQQPPVIFKPKTGLACAIKFQQGGIATAASEKTPPAGKLAMPSAAAVAIPAVVSSDSSAKQALIAMAPEIDLETIEVKGIPDRRAPTKIDVDADDLEIGIFTDGSMDLLVDDGLDDAHLKLSAGAVNKMRQFLGLFQESA